MIHATLSVCTGSSAKIIPANAAAATLSPAARRAIAMTSQALIACITILSTWCSTGETIPPSAVS